MAGASLQIVDSIEKLAHLLVQVSKLSGEGLKEEEWEFLGCWHTLTPKREEGEIR